MKTISIEVTQLHVDKANLIRTYSSDFVAATMWCPIAIAVRTAGRWDFRARWTSLRRFSRLTASSRKLAAAWDNMRPLPPLPYICTVVVED